MKCPDCQGNLLPVSVTGFDESSRCSVCGGFWMQSWVVSKVAEDDIDHWTRLGLKTEPNLRTNLCPKDGTTLVNGSGGVMPDTVEAKKCNSCNWWWMPGDTLFDYRAAMVAKKSYLRWWGGKSSDALMAFLPALLVVIMAVGIAYGANMIRKKTSFGVPARNPKIFFSTVSLGKGNMQVNISSVEKLEKAELIKKGENEGREVVLERSDEIYQLKLEGLEINQVYILKIDGERFEFEVK